MINFNSSVFHKLFYSGSYKEDAPLIGTYKMNNRVISSVQGHREIAHFTQLQFVTM